MTGFRRAAVVRKPDSHHAYRSGVIFIWIAIGVLLPFATGADTARLGQYEFIATLVMMGIGLNIVLGYAGILFLGPSALLASGAYGAAIMATRFQAFQNLPLMCLTAIVVAAVVAVIVAVATLRVGGFYLGMVTLFLALVIPLVAEHLSLTGGNDGLLLQLVPTFYQHPSGTTLYEVGVGMIAFLALFAWLIKNSRLGRQLAMIKASEELAQSVGVSPYRTKFIAFVLTSVPCGLAGGFYVFSQQFISPNSLTVQDSIYIIAGVVIGGSGTTIGPVLGVALIGAGSQFLGGFRQYEGLIYGGLLVLVAILAPSGVVGFYDDLLERIRGRRKRDRFMDVVVDADNFDAAGGTPSLRDDGEGAHPALEVTGARRRFGGVQALDGVDLRVERGRIHALVGPNGSGKTTLLNLITGYYSLDGGTVHLGDVRLDRLGGAAATARHGVVRTFQTPKLMNDDTCLANVMVAADHVSGGSLATAVLHTPNARRAEYESGHRAAAAINSVGLTDRCADAAGLVPHGLQRLLEIARAVAMEPAFVLLDEPAAGLSGAEAETLKDVVRGMAAAGHGVLIVEHNLPIVFDIADTVTVLDRGLVIATGTPQEVVADPEVVRVYIGRQRSDERSQAAAVTEGVIT
jgi:ABC-type branched-subunit amino acid transport system ATPase component/ABC-type branched-subunit amino acid transport system permease subunit